MGKQASKKKMAFSMRLPLIIFEVSVLLGILMALLVQNYVDSINRDNGLAQAKSSVPIFKEVLKPALSQRTTSAFIEAAKNLGDHNSSFKLTIWDDKLNPIFSNSSSTQELIDYVRANRDYHIKEVVILAEEARLLEEKREKAKTAQVAILKAELFQVFFPLRSDSQKYFASVSSRIASSSIFLKIKLGAYLIALLASFAITGLAALLAKYYSKPVVQVRDALVSWVEEGSYKNIEPKTEDAIARYLQDINEVVNNGSIVLSSGSLYLDENTAISETAIGDTIGNTSHEDTAISTMLAELCSKTLQKYKDLEVVLYPRIPSAESSSFISSLSNNSGHHFLFANFGDNHERANIQKNRIQERFYTLVEDDSNVGHRVWSALNQLHTLEPGMLYLRTDAGKLLASCSGPYYIYGAKASGEIESIQIGYTYFTDSYVEAEELDIATYELFLIVPGDFLKGLGLNADEFAFRILGQVQYSSTTKEFFISIMNTIYGNTLGLDANQKIPGLITVFKPK